MKKQFIYFLIFGLLLACKKTEQDPPTVSLPSHIQYFGFTLIDTYWDDPSDAETKTNYADEVYTFSNLADILVVNPSDSLNHRLQTFFDFNLKAVLHLHELFFEFIDTNGSSGANYDLRANYQERWDQFKSANQSVLSANTIAAFYIGEEPTWNGISYYELNTVALLVKKDFPGIPLMMIEAYPALKDLQVPPKIDWVGFDRYFIKNPNSSAAFQENWKLLLSKLSNSSQRIMVIMDSHYIQELHGDYGNISIQEMNTVANNYYELAKNNERVIGLLGYFWPNGFDIATSTGARGMPENVKAEYYKIGKEITGKK